MTHTATADTPLPRAFDRYDAICHSISVFGAERRVTPEGSSFDFPFGSAFVRAHDKRLELRAEASDLDALARLKEIVASSVGFHARGEGITITWRGDSFSSQTLRQFRLMTIVSVEQLTPRMRRIRLSGQNLARFGALGGLHVRLLLPTDEAPFPDMPVQGPDGLPYWPDEAKKPAGRIYTIRKLDVAEGWIDIDVVTHSGGIGGRWAMTTAPGDTVGVIGPLGRPVRSADWYVLGADETGIPALARILEALPPSSKATAYIEVENKAEEQALSFGPNVRLRWIHRDDPSASTLAQMIAAEVWPGDRICYGWVAAEAAAIDHIRQVWRGPGGPGAERTMAAVYWRQGEPAQTQ